MRSEPPARSSAARWLSWALGSGAIGGRWSALIVLFTVLAASLHAVRLPAALLLGPMIAAILIAAAGTHLQVTRAAFLLAQGVIGAMIARSIPPSLFGEMLRDGPLFLSAVIAVIGVSAALGWLLARWRVLPGTTAVWGSVPGAATAMMLMAEAHGADGLLVAFMQYLRVILVAVVASVVCRLWVPDAGHASGAGAWFAPIQWHHFAGTMMLIGSAVLLSVRLHMPAGPLLLPFIAGMALQAAGLLTIELPPWLLALSYALVGWSIGLRFNRPLLLHAARALPRVIASILVLVVLCGGLAALLVVLAGIDPLTAYLATSPGGADTAVIIAASSHVDLPFVMSLQTTRFILVLLVGPSLARFIAGRLEASRKPA